MKKTGIIALATLALLTVQCAKNESKTNEKVMVPITGTASFGGSKTEITTDGVISPVNGDIIYIYNNSGDNVGSVTCKNVTGQRFDFSGEIENGCLGTKCMFMYLGTGSVDANGVSINGGSTTISFADQREVKIENGKISGMNKFHVGSCLADVSQEGTVTLPQMLSDMSIAYFQLKDDEGTAIANQDVIVSGLYSTANINGAAGTLSGENEGDITVHTNGEGGFYMALIPQDGPVNFTFEYTNYEGTRLFSYGIKECSFYSEQGGGGPLNVTMAQYVDLRLPSGTLWATSNVGAASPEDYGYYFMWGSTKDGGDPDCSWANCPGNGGASSANATSLTTWNSDNLTDNVLNSDVDAASIICGDKWRMPTRTDWQELKDICEVSLETKGGKAGCRVTGPNGRSIFLPAAGYRGGTSVTINNNGYYWTSSLSDIQKAHSIAIISGNISSITDERRYGEPVRPVRKVRK